MLIDGRQNDRCSIKPDHTFTNGQTVPIVIDSRNIIDYATWKINDTIVKEDFQESKFNTTVHPSLEGIWEFKLLNRKDNNDMNVAIEHKQGHNYTKRICFTNVKIVPGQLPDQNSNLVIILITGSVVAVIIIFAQASYIVYLKSKAQAINRHQNLSKKSESTNTNDRARYCSDPGQKMVKIVALVDPDKESDTIYEAPQIELPVREERGAVHPPQPPAVNTIPRNPRVDTEKLGPLTIAALNARQAQTANYPTPKPIQHEMIVANRPPLPLPQDTYEEMLVEENTYEPPPANILPILKSSVQPKLTKDQLDTAVKALTNKPAVTPKPPRPRTNSDTMKIPNELENAWRRRNVVQVPIVSIPGPSSRNASPHRLRKPPPAVKSKPPVPQPLDQGIYYNQRQDSSDEEWTYEPLQPMKGYNIENIYNV
ncbi:uncharacterized protein LOC113498991 [Trichoplusia ni]|uniref:Uncharacterized protein LOC113498991 n=1 Tax=Trichoplusia ni TaxID=7111 RepID=A0A7E5W4B4_TRINI|nr:uncharacterized protein LOC113498991 [Trichoplusia ni]